LVASTRFDEEASGDSLGPPAHDNDGLSFMVQAGRAHAGSDLFVNLLFVDDEDRHACSEHRAELNPQAKTLVIEYERPRRRLHEGQ
jgi:hypothetical protein